VGSFVVDGCRKLIEPQMIRLQVGGFIAHMRKMGLSKQAIRDCIEEAFGNE
jgi:DNA-binding transcriptional regulator YhcF (GntR family)